MLEAFATNQDKVELPYLLHAVTYHPLRTRCVLHEVELEVAVFMQRVGEFALVPLDDVEQVLLGQGRYLF